MLSKFYSKKRIIKSIVISSISLCVLFILTIFDGIRQQHRIEAPVVFSMHDLGYLTSEVVSAKLIESKIKESGQSVLAYNLYLKSSDENNEPVLLEFTVYLCSEEDVVKVFESSIIAIKESERPHCKTTKCYYPAIVYNDAIKEMYQLNSNVWGIDLGYSQVDYSDTSSWNKNIYQMALLKDNKVMSIKIDKDINLSNEVIESIISMFKKVEEMKVGEK